MGSSSPIRFDPERIRERLRVPFTRDHYAAAGIDIAGMIARYLVKQAEYGPDFDRSRLRDVNRDLFPKDEFLIPHVGS
jgi:hypothetical protein